MKKLFKKIFGSRNDRLLADYSKIVDEINLFEDHLKSLSDQEILAKTEELKSKYEKQNYLKIGMFICCSSDVDSKFVC